MEGEHEEEAPSIKLKTFSISNVRALFWVWDAL